MIMEKLDLTQILRDCPKGTKLYSPLFGDVFFMEINYNSLYPIRVMCQMIAKTFTKEGRFLIEYEDAECMLFPSRENRDWSMFKVEQPKPKFEPFQKVLARDSDDEAWHACYFSHYRVGTKCPYYCSEGPYVMCIPYEGNEHLLGTTNEPNEQWI